MKLTPQQDRLYQQGWHEGMARWLRQTEPRSEVRDAFVKYCERVARQNKRAHKRHSS